jgi:DNA-binding transcriptional MocR family regulator
MRTTVLNLEESRRSAKSPTPAWGAATCWPSGSARATRSRRTSSARRPSNRCSDGETFYAHNLGLPELRDAIAALHVEAARPRRRRAHRRHFGGVNALMLAVQALVDAGDEVVAVTPVWPNLTAQPQIMGAKLKRVSLQPQGRAPGRWTCRRCWRPSRRPPAADRQRAEQPDRLDLSRAEQQAILEHCRKTGTWILADEVYERLYYAPGAMAAPRASSTSPSRTTGWSWRTASPRAS